MYGYTFEDDGDYIVLLALRNGEWIECSRWLVPGSQMDDAS